MESWSVWRIYCIIKLTENKKIKMAKGKEPNPGSIQPPQAGGNRLEELGVLLDIEDRSDHERTQQELAKSLKKYELGSDHAYISRDGSGRSFYIESISPHTGNVKIKCNVAGADWKIIRKWWKREFTREEFLNVFSLDEFELSSGQDKSLEDKIKKLEAEFGKPGDNISINRREREIIRYAYDAKRKEYQIVLKPVGRSAPNTYSISELRELAKTGVAKKVIEKDSKEEEKEKKREGLILVPLDKNGNPVEDYEETDPARAGAAHTLYKLNQKEGWDVSDLVPEEEIESIERDSQNDPVRLNLRSWDNASEEEKARRKEALDEHFNELTRELWDLLVTHGYAEEQEDGTYKMTKEVSDLDGESCLTLCRLAGLDNAKVKYVPQGQGEDEEGVVMDTSNRDGIVGLAGGRTVIGDHHGDKSGRDTSATKHVYEFLIANGLLGQEKYLDQYIRFVTQEDNKTYIESELRENFPNSWQTLRGLNQYIAPVDIINLFKESELAGKPFNPDEPLPEKFLEEYKYQARTDHPIDQKNNGKSLKELGEIVKDRIERSLVAIRRLEKEGFVLDTGEKAFGRILIDTGIIKDKDGKKIMKSIPMGHDAVRAAGFGGYLIWTPKHNGFVLYVTNPLRDELYPEREIKFSQGFNVRGNMWLKPRNQELIQVTLEEIVSKLSRKRTKVPLELKKALAKKGLESTLVDLPPGSELPGGAKKENEVREVSQERWEWLESAIKNFAKEGKEYKKLLDEEKIFTIEGNTLEEKEKNKKAKLEKYVREGLDNYNNYLRETEKFDEVELNYMAQMIMDNIYS